MKKTQSGLHITVLLMAGLLMDLTELNAQNNDFPLRKTEEKMVTIAALTTVGNLSTLTSELHIGLDAGLTINQIREIMIQLYPYAGLPRSLQGLNTFLEVLYERKSEGIKDETGTEATPIKDTRSRYLRGKENLEKLTRRRETAPTGAYAFAPVIDQFQKEHLYADLYERDILTPGERELVAISALAALQGVEPSLQMHLSMGLNAGLTGSELAQVMQLIALYINPEQGKTGQEVLQQIIQQRK